MLKNRLKILRESKKLTQQELADKLNLSRVRYNNYETGKRNPDYEVLQLIADFYDVSIDYLLGKTESTPKKGIKIPVLGKVAAGIPIEAIENYDSDEWEEIPVNLAKCGEYFALKIKGESMEPKFSNGDVVIVKKQDDVESGEIGVVIVNGCDATVKKIVKQSNGIMLVASNNEIYPPKFFDRESIENLPVKIIGKVVELRAKF